MDYRWLQRPMYSCRSIVQWRRPNDNSSWNNNNIIKFPLTFSNKLFGIGHFGQDDLMSYPDVTNYTSSSLSELTISSSSLCQISIIVIFTSSQISKYI